MPAQGAKNLILWLLKPFYSNDRQYWKVVLLCFTVASIFWLLNALNKSYTNIRTTYPLRFVYNEEKFIPLKPLPQEIDINVSGKGWKLLRKFLHLNVRPAEVVWLSLPQQSYLPGSALRQNIATVLDGLQLNFVFTDTIHFAMDRRVRRKIPLAVDSTTLKTASNVVIASPIEINPDSVLFDGPASIVSKFPTPFPVKLPITDIDRSFKRYVPVEYSHQALVKANVQEVDVSFAVSPLIWDEKILVPVVLNAPENLGLILQPGNVTVLYAYRQSNAAAITADQFEVSLNYLKINPADSTVAVEISRRPVQIHRLQIQPNRVKLNIFR